MHIFEEPSKKADVMKKIKSILALVVLTLFLVGCSNTQQVCGSKKDHKARAAKTKRMAPSMSGGR